MVMSSALSAGQRLVLSHVFGEGTTTRPALVAATGLSKPSVNDAVAALTERGFFAQAGRDTPHTGKPAVRFRATTQTGWVLAVDCGSAHVRVLSSDLAATDVRTDQVHDRHWSTRDRGEPLPAHVLDRAQHLVARAMAEQPQPPAAVAVALPRILATEERSWTPAVPEEVATVLAPVLETGDREKVLLENDVNCAALAEYRCGTAQERKTITYLHLGRGIGAGTIAGGRILRGAHGAAGEISRIPYPGVPSCTGMEQRLSVDRMVEAVGAGAHRAPHSPGDVVAWLVRSATAADAGHARAMIEQYTGDVAMACATIAAVVDPEAIVLGGQLSRADAIVAAVQDKVGTLNEFATIVPSSLDARATGLGALTLALDRAHVDLLGEHASHAATVVGRAAPSR